MSSPIFSTIVTQSSAISMPKCLYVRADTKCPSYHPLFSQPEADVVLRSTQGTLYRMHSHTLRSTSGFFETMFSLPQPKNHQQFHQEDGEKAKLGLPETIVLDVYENDAPLERLLRLMNGLPLAKWESLDEVDDVLSIAEKWDTPGPISLIRFALTSHHLLQQDPIKCYMLATHFGWKTEAAQASKETLTLNLYDDIHSHILSQMSSKDVLPLLNLHRRRRDIFRQLLDSPERFTAGNSFPYHCNRCGVTELDNRPWRMFKQAMFLEMERRPLGDTLGLAFGDSAEWPEALACWEVKCPKIDCGALNYDRIATLRQIRIVISLLPSTIEE